MKSKITLLLILICAVAINSKAQEYNSAIGLRLGSPWGISYKKFIDEKNAIEGVVSFRSHDYYSWFSIGGFYEHHEPFPNTKGLYWYYGGGAALAFASYDDDYFTDEPSSVAILLSGIIGLDYKFDGTPLSITLDWTPTFIISDYGDGFDGGYGAIGVRYVLD